ncbi:MAG: stress response protein [Jatrophihabitantaceae bacterium]
MDETDWEIARLIPVSGINGPDEQERRGSSALLAVLGSVKEFGRTILGPLGAPAGLIETFIEVPFVLGDRSVRPDGVIRVTRGKQVWTALVEVKTGRNSLQTTQLESYLEVARELQFDVVLTISNELVGAPGEHPTTVDKRKLRRVALKHMSWSQIHTEAVIQRVNRSVADPDQAWILSELIRYLEHDRSGAVDFDEMGPHWVAVRNGAANRTLRATDPEAAEVVARFGQLVSFAGMRLSRNLGVEVRPALSKADLRDFAAFQQRAVGRLVDSGILHGSLRVPNAVAPIAIVADLRSGLITCSIDVAAPGQGRNSTRVNWLTRQLAKAPDAVLIEGWSAWARTPGPCRVISDVRAKPDLLYDDPKKELRSFTVRLSAIAGTKRSHGHGSFVGSVLALVNTFYEQVVQQIRPWSPPAPSLKVRADADDGGDDRDDISGELPLKSVQRASGSPDWNPPESQNVLLDELVFATNVPASERPPADLPPGASTTANEPGDDRPDADMEVAATPELEATPSTD